ncbi:MAG: hypothetical protein JNM57_10765 [Cyclobacteriaceae bacterium]|nr:hypothetical protein [Cyclobacteriaceae bacterium]
MKTNTFYCLLLIVFITSCGSKELTRTDALNILRTSQDYPTTIDYTLYCNDGNVANRVAKSSLVSDGYVIMAEVRSADKPFFSFTEKAKPFLIKVSDRERALGIQVVKLADEILIDVTGISTDANSTTATVLYATRLESISPFAVLLDKGLTTDKSRKAFFKRYDDGWRIEKRDF